MAACKPFTYLGGTSLFRHVLQQKPKSNIVLVNIIRTARIDSGKKSTKIFRGSTKSEPAENGQTSRFSFLKGKFQQKNTKTENLTDLLHVEDNPITPGILWKPFLFSIGFSATSIGLCAIWQYENVRKKSKNFLQSPVTWTFDKFKSYNKKQLEWRQKLNNIWNELNEAQKAFVPICFANVLVFLAWRIKGFQPAMIRYFCSNPASSALCWPMVLSTFSHYNALHLGLNMYVLYSFSSIVINVLGKEQFTGLYLSAGVLSSFASLVFKTLAKQPGLSMGASGAIMAVLGYVCVRKPDVELQIVFLPFFTFYALNGLKCLMAVDTAGLILGWKFFDHAAHLGGAICGISWFYWGNQYIWKKREPLLVWWHEIRTAAEK